MKHILPILILFISINFYSQVVHPLDGTNIKQLNCGESVSYVDPGGNQGDYLINLSRYESGIYIIEVIIDGIRSKEKVVIQ